MTDDFEENVFEVMDDLRGDNRVAVPDVGTIRRRARKQQNRMRSVAGAACLAVVAVIGAGVRANIGDSPATTETAGINQEGDQGVTELPAVASDSAPVEVGGPDEIDSKESLGEWMLANRLRDDRRPFVVLTASDSDPTTDGVQLHVSAFPLDGSFEYFAVVRAECGPRLQYGMIEFTDGSASFFEGRLPDTESISWGDVGYDCSPPGAEDLERVLLSEFEIVPTATGLILRNDTDQVSFVLTDTEGNPLAALPEPDGLQLPNEIARDYLFSHENWQYHDGAGEFDRIGLSFPADGSDEWLGFYTDDDPLDVIQLQTGCAGVTYRIKWNAEGFEVISPFTPSGPQDGEICEPSDGIAAAPLGPGTQVNVTMENGQVLLKTAKPDQAWTIFLNLSGPIETPLDDIETSVDILTGEPEGGRGWNALSSFTLQYDGDLNCLYHDEPDNNGEPGTGGRVAIVWPAEYSAVRDGVGVIVRNPVGDIVARSGETFQIGGGMRTGGSGHCGSIGEWIANGGPKTESEAEPAPTTTTDFSSTPAGDWTARSVVVDGVELLHPTNAQTLTITDETLSANDGCNSWGGTAQWDLSGAFAQVGDTTSTARLCLDGGESEAAYHEAIRRATNWEVTSDGVLLLIGPMSRIELT